MHLQWVTTMPLRFPRQSCRQHRPNIHHCPMQFKPAHQNWMPGKARFGQTWMPRKQLTLNSPVECPSMPSLFIRRPIWFSVCHLALKTRKLNCHAHLRASRYWLIEKAQRSLRYEISNFPLLLIIARIFLRLSCSRKKSFHSAHTMSSHRGG